jgi:magnesium transporter
MLVGLINGIAIAILVGSGAGLWFSNPELGGVIGLALVINMLVAGLAGVLIPLTLNRLKLDPAVSSGVFVSTVTDVVGFFAFLGIAALWFGLL